MLERIDQLLAANAAKLAEYEKAIAPIQEAHQKAILAAEEEYRIALESYVPEGVYETTQGTNTNYWQRVGPMLASYMMKWYEMEKQRELDVKCEAINIEFKAKIQIVTDAFFPEGFC